MISVNAHSKGMQKGAKVYNILESGYLVSIIIHIIITLNEKIY